MTVDGMTLKALVGKGSEDDLLRETMQYLANRMMDLEVESLTWVAHGEPTPARTNQRNGYRGRARETRVGTVELDIPKLRKGSNFLGGGGRGYLARRRNPLRWDVVSSALGAASLRRGPQA